jgi:predicted house-cleaning noncanonical NTP pyrophosphatase (MazG superfamily)
MPVVLSQRTWHAGADPKYLDREGVIYHYPRQYRGRINDFDRFIYYRPATGALEGERSTYIGHGVLAASFEDWARPDHWFVDVAWYEAFGRPVPLRQNGLFVETESSTSPQFPVLGTMKAYDKLVRDRIPEIIESAGKKAKWRELNAHEFRLALRAKVLEEAKELVDAPDDALLSELADLSEVTDAMLRAYNLTLEELEAARHRKNDERGAFTKRLFLESVSD